MKKTDHHLTARLFGLLLLGFISACATQEAAENTPDDRPPNTDIYLADMNMESGAPVLSGLRAAVAGDGYDNQPSFLPGGDAFFFSAEGPSGKTDIWRQMTASGEREQVTATPGRSEYSPRLSPDGTSVSYIQESPDGAMTELHTRPLSGGDGQAAIALAPLGYYAWFDGGTKTAVFLRSEPASLQIVDVATGEATALADDIGRGLYPAPDGAGVLFTTRRDDGGFLVNLYRAETGALEPLFPLVGASQDYAVFALEDGRDGFLCADGSIVYFRTSTGADTWQIISDLSDAGITGVSRLAASSDLSTIALVVTR